MVCVRRGLSAAGGWVVDGEAWTASGVGRRWTPRPEWPTSGLAISGEGRPCRRWLIGRGASRLPRTPSGGLGSPYGGPTRADHEF
jgi:hypothetical protein